MYMDIIYNLYLNYIKINTIYILIINIICFYFKLHLLYNKFNNILNLLCL